MRLPWFHLVVNMFLCKTSVEVWFFWLVLILYHINWEKNKGNNYKLVPDIFLWFISFLIIPLFDNLEIFFYFSKNSKTTDSKF